jgi:hypothetical protein
MTKMNPVDSGFQRPLDGTTERHRMSTLVIVAMGVAALVAGGMLFYSLSNTLSDKSSTAATKSIEQSVPPTTTGKGGTMFNPTPAEPPVSR